MDTGGYLTNSNWELLGTEGKRNEIYYACCSEPYLDITFTVKLRRRPQQYWRNVIIPSAVITLVSILSLLIPASASLPRFIVIFLSFLLLGLKFSKDIPLQVYWLVLPHSPYCPHSLHHHHFLCQQYTS